MTIDELKAKLMEAIEKYKGDTETLHGEADELLLEYINDTEVTALYNSFEKWYA
jgi:hypothetical protein